MKNLILICLLFAMSSQLTAQTYKYMKFQAIARDADDEIISDAIEVRLTILEGADDGTAIYVDEQTVTPNERGLFSVNIGQSPQSGNYTEINWAANIYYLMAEIRTELGEPYQSLGPAQALRSVPYALYGEDDDSDPENELQTLKLYADGELNIINGNTINTGIPNTKIVSIPCASLQHDAEPVMTDNAYSINWEADFRATGSVFLQKPNDYIGGDVTFRIAFLVSTTETGDVHFFIRPRSTDVGGNLADVPAIVPEPVSIDLNDGRQHLYVQEITISEDRLENDWWYITIQRNSGPASLISNNVFVVGTSFEYHIR